MTAPQKPGACVGEICSLDDWKQSSFCQGAVPDIPARGSTQRLHFPGGEWRKIIMVNVALALRRGRLSSSWASRVSQGREGEHLGLPRVKRPDPCARGLTSTWHQIGGYRITATIRSQPALQDPLADVVFDAVSKACLACVAFSSSSPAISSTTDLPNWLMACSAQISQMGDPISR